MGLLSFLFGRTPKISDQSPKPEAAPEMATLCQQPLSVPHVERSASNFPACGDYRFIALDVETANDWGGSICQIGLAVVGKGDEIATFCSLIDPECDFAPFNIQLHGIDEQAVRGMPKFRDFMRDLAPILIRQPIIQHSTFDERAIRAACDDSGTEVPRIKWLDSVQIARRAWPELIGNGGHGLANLKRFLSLQFNHHDAGEDARAAAMVTLAAERRTGITFAELATGRIRQPKSLPRNVTIAGVEGQLLSGMIVVFTGALEIPREEAITLATTRGLTVKPSVTLKTDFVVVGEQDLSMLAGHQKSSKHRRAEELAENGHPLRIIREAEFVQLCIRGRLE